MTFGVAGRECIWMGRLSSKLSLPSSSVSICSTSSSDRRCDNSSMSATTADTSATAASGEDKDTSVSVRLLAAQLDNCSGLRSSLQRRRGLNWLGSLEAQFDRDSRLPLEGPWKGVVGSRWSAAHDRGHWPLRMSSSFGVRRAWTWGEDWRPLLAGKSDWGCLGGCRSQDYSRCTTL